jgi:hypothetical protein
VLLGLALPVGAARAADTTLWGVNPGLPLLFFQQGGALPRKDLQTIHGAGIGQVLADAVWAGAVASPGSEAWQWGPTDAYVAALASYHTRWYPRIDYTPSFYSTNPALIEGGDPLPQYLPELEAYARALAQRYGPNGAFWASNPYLPKLPVEDYEVWNEPDVPGVMDESGGAGAAAYMAMYAAARRGIHAADANAVVTFGGLALDGGDPIPGGESAGAWLAQAVGSDPQQPIDAVGIHPYPYEIAANGLVGGVFGQVEYARQEMNALGLSAVPIQATEVGFASRYAGLASSPGDEGLAFTNAQRSQAMKTVALELPHSNCGVDAVIPFAWNTDREVQDESQGVARYVYTQYQMVSPTDQTFGFEEQGFKQAIAQSKLLGTKTFSIC